MKDVTVLVTVYNSIKTITNCINSILDSDFKNFEIIVIDGFSTDGTYDALKKYGKKIRLYQKKGNAAVGFNEGIKKTESKYLAFTDADCVVDKSWIYELKKGFVNKEIVSTAGFCGTPSNMGLLPELIGKELESRFNDATEYVSRAPTMNLMVKTEYAKKVMFKEDLAIAFETDFGYRLLNFGKIKYVPSAKVEHYQRTDLKGFFKQQKNYAKYALKVYFQKGHQEKIKGDHITTFDMVLQITFFNLSLLFIALYFISPYIIQYFLLGSFLALILTYSYRILKVKVNLSKKIMIFPLFVFRNIAWNFGFLQGLFT